MAVRRRQRQTYIEGNTVRKIQPLERQPKRRQGQEHRSRRRAKEKLHIQYVNILYGISVYCCGYGAVVLCKLSSASGGDDQQSQAYSSIRNAA